VQYVKLFYEKDKVVLIDGKTVPDFPKEELAKYTPGYQYLAVAQHSLGHPILNDLSIIWRRIQPCIHLMDQSLTRLF
jgi:hypothetical protein